MTIGPTFEDSALSAVTADSAKLVYAGRGYVKRISVAISATPRWLKVYDKATAPASTDTPAWRMWCPIGQTIGDFTQIPIRFKLGLGYRFSLGGANADVAYTGFADSDAAVNVQYQKG